MKITNPSELAAFNGLREALKGCSGCAYDEAEGGLVDHCEECCHNVTAVAWAFMSLALAPEEANRGELVRDGQRTVQQQEKP